MFDSFLVAAPQRCTYMRLSPPRLTLLFYKECYITKDRIAFLHAADGWTLRISSQSLREDVFVEQGNDKEDYPQDEKCDAELLAHSPVHVCNHCYTAR
mmetsp:Transcript_22112/g.30941  ORF Transcript_22112/g.30941 Transcript_22112/m.30941 type:complete len:98 (+) Transcript_22112:58-351(+)